MEESWWASAWGQPPRGPAARRSPQGYELGQGRWASTGHNPARPHEGQQCVPCNMRGPLRCPGWKGQDLSGPYPWQPAVLSPRGDPCAGSTPLTVRPHPWAEKSGVCRTKPTGCPLPGLHELCHKGLCPQGPHRVDALCPHDADRHTSNAILRRGGREVAPLWATPAGTEIVTSAPSGGCSTRSGWDWASTCSRPGS